ncbi:Vpu [Lentisphaerota bacterium WC36G]|nr:Vpu [Lentisphaerae bacterium WC36]
MKKNELIKGLIVVTLAIIVVVVGYYVGTQDYKRLKVQSEIENRKNRIEPMKIESGSEKLDRIFATNALFRELKQTQSQIESKNLSQKNILEIKEKLKDIFNKAEKINSPRDKNDLKKLIKAQEKQLSELEKTSKFFN